MKILLTQQLSPPLVIGGYELSCARVARAMADKGHEVRVLTTWSHLPNHDNERASGHS